MYGIAEAARLLGLRPDRARAWLDGYSRRGVVHPPVIRNESTGDEIVTWREFVALAYVRERRYSGATLQRLRQVLSNGSLVGAVVKQLRPAGIASPVVIDPLVRFGYPTVHGVTTGRLWELHDTGETVEQIAIGYDLPKEAVSAAIAYEEQLRP